MEDLRRGLLRKPYQSDAAAPDHSLPRVVLDVCKDFGGDIDVVSTLIFDGSIEVVNLLLSVRICVFETTNYELASVTDEESLVADSQVCESRHEN